MFTGPKKQKRYKSEKEIKEAIDANYFRIQELIKEAEDCETKGRQYIRVGDEALKEQGNMLLDRARQIRESSIPRIDNRLEKLKNALSAFNTIMLPGIGNSEGVKGNDRAVVLERLT